MCVVPYPSSQALCVARVAWLARVRDDLSLRSTTSRRTRSRVEQLWPEHEPPLEPEIVHVKVADPVALVVSPPSPVVVWWPPSSGCREIRPVEALIDRPAGSPVAE